MELKQVKTDGGPDTLTTVKDEPLDASSDYLTDNNKQDPYSFWNQDSNSIVDDSFNNGSSTCTTPVNSSPPKAVSQTKTSSAAWSSSGSDLNRTSPTCSTNLSSVQISNQAFSPAGSMQGQTSSHLLTGPPAAKSENHFSMGTSNETSLTAPQSHMPYGGPTRVPVVAAVANSLVFTPSPVTQFLSTTSRSETTQKYTSQVTKNMSPNMREPDSIDVTQVNGISHGIPQSMQYSPTSTTSPGGTSVTSPQSKDIQIGNSNMTMKEFINKIIEAGKCLQLLNYRVRYLLLLVLKIISVYLLLYFSLWK